MTRAKTVKCKASYCAHGVQLKAEKNSVAFSVSSAELPSFLTGFSNPFWHLRHLNSWWEELTLWRRESHFRFTVQSLTKSANSFYGMYCENSLFNMSLKSVLVQYTSLILNYKRTSNTIYGLFKLVVRVAQQIIPEISFVLSIKHKICSANKLFYFSIFSMYFYVTIIYV